MEMCIRDRDIVLPPDTLMILVIQKDIPMIPHGGTLLHEGDVAVLSAHEYQGGSAISLQAVSYTHLIAKSGSSYHTWEEPLLY